MSSIYHYCTTESFKSILEYKTLRLSDIAKSNDSREIRFLFEEYFKLNINKYVANRTKEELTSILKIKKVMDLKLNEVLFLVLCFSKNQDDLHMWNCYGNKGVCIEFDREKLEEHLKLFRSNDGINKKINKSKRKTDFQQLVIQDVEYKNENDLLYDFLTKLDGYSEKYKFSIILNECPRVKSDFFKCESEVRIIYRFQKNSYNSSLKTQNNYLIYDNPINKTNKIYFKSISTDNYPHKMIIDLPFDMTLIKSITIGPNCKLTIEDIRELLFIYNINHLDKSKIKKSKGTLR